MRLWKPPVMSRSNSTNTCRHAIRMSSTARSSRRLPPAHKYCRRNWSGRLRHADAREYRPSRRHGF